MLAVLCPGQGSQKPGGLLPWLNSGEDRSFARSLGEWAGCDLVRHGCESDQETLRDTAVAQPLIVATGLLAWSQLTRRFDLDAENLVVAGHSVGEITAAVIADVLTAEQGMALAAGRGRAMAEAARARATGMAAVIGVADDTLERILDEHCLSVANLNGDGQVVVAGPQDRLAALRADRSHGGRVVPLKVAGAFHTSFMAEAVPAVRRLTSTFSPRDPRCILLSNQGGQQLVTGSQATSTLVEQMVRPVRWDLTMAAVVGTGAAAAVELPPAGVLQGLLSRSHPGLRCTRLDRPEQIDTVAEVLAPSGATQPLM
jgi:[acyl-carrier-protein] S-malonyltransferase